MTGDGFTWVACTPSHERRSWLRLAAAGCGAVALLVAAAAAAEPSAARWMGAALGIGGAVLSFRQSQAAGNLGELRLDGSGTFWWRSGSEAAAERLVATGLSHWLAAFEVAAADRLVWRDSLPPAQWRRLRACVRWHVDRDLDASDTAHAQDQPRHR